MSEIPTELHYTASHEWVRLEDDGTVTVGITDHAQQALGDLVFIETPEVGIEYAAEEACCVIESVKAASDMYMPINGEVIAANEVLIDEPEMVNSSPYDDGWIFKIKPVDEDDIGQLMDSATYQAEIEEE
jgi:glycine cleavage system H protein